jgi:hypothetical protein
VSSADIFSEFESINCPQKTMGLTMALAVMLSNLLGIDGALSRSPSKGLMVSGNRGSIACETVKKDLNLAKVLSFK